MRLLHVADLHLRWFSWVESHASSVDLVVIAGDLHDLFSNLTFTTQVRRCSDWLLSLPTPVVVCSGNHDAFGHGPSESDEHAWLPRLSGKGNIIAADGQSVTLHDLTIATVGWAQLPRWPASTSIVVAHAPPSGCECAYEEYSSRDLGDVDLRDAIEQHPSRMLILSGHVHAPRKRVSRMTNGSLVLVPGCDMTALRPHHWVVDTTAGIATWHGHPDDPVEHIRLVQNRHSHSD